MAAYLQYYRSASKRDAIKTYKVLGGATVESLNNFSRGSTIEENGTILFKGKSNLVDELRMRYKVKMVEV